MNTFVTIVTDGRFQYEKVTYYSVLYSQEDEDGHGEGLWEIDKFFEKLEQRADEEDASNFIAWLEEIGNERGAKKMYFRDEDAFYALPPPRRFLSELIITEQWRLYCYRISERVVILFNGDIKTTQKALDCPNVAPYFRQAQRLTKRIDEKIRDGEIRVMDDRLLFDDDLEIIL